MNGRIQNKIMPLALALVLLAGCGEKSQCEIPSRHVHKYTKEFEDGTSIVNYLDEEYLSTYGYNWSEEYIEINKVDEEIYRLLNSKLLFDGVDNWEYLFNQMASYHDYLRYYYYYTTYETRTKTDSKGNTITYTETVVHEGWHNNKYDSNNTGKVRLYHHKFYGYRVIYDNGRFKLEQSPLADDIRQFIYDYPYIGERPVTEVYETFYKSKYELWDLTPEDFDIFGQPDLDNPDLDANLLRISK